MESAPRERLPQGLSARQPGPDRRTFSKRDKTSSTGVMIATFRGRDALSDPLLDFTFAPSADIRTDFQGLWEPPLANPKPSRTPRNTDALKDSRKAQKPFALR
jgi:hypothetical protein